MLDSYFFLDTVFCSFSSPSWFTRSRSIGKTFLYSFLSIFLFIFIGCKGIDLSPDRRRQFACLFCNAAIHLSFIHPSSSEYLALGRRSITTKNLKPPCYECVDCCYYSRRHLSTTIILAHHSSLTCWEFKYDDTWTRLFLRYPKIPHAKIHICIRIPHHIHVKYPIEFLHI